LLRHFIFSLIIFTSSVNALDVVRFVESKSDQKQAYFVDLLRLSMEVTKDKYGEYVVEGIEMEMEQGRSSIMLANNQHIDIVWRMTNKEIEQALKPIYIPLLKGSMGYRIFLIREGEQVVFSKDLTLSQLKDLRVGQGHNWPDSKILAHNGFNLTKGYSNNLLKMLSKGRFDYFPRALHEALIEAKSFESIEVEQNFLLKYHAPVYFFVNNKDDALARRLHEGLMLLIESGKFDHHFNTHPVTANVLKQVDLNGREAFLLDNPFNSDETNVLKSEPQFWLTFNPSH